MFTRRTVRDTINVQPASAPMVAGIAFAVGLSIGACVFLIPFALTHKGGKSAEVKTAAMSTTSGIAAPAPPPSAATPDESTATAAAAAADTSGCDRQAWPYITPECREQLTRKSGSRQVRVIATDSNAPATIATPAPVIPPAPKPAPAPTIEQTQSVVPPKRVEQAAPKPAPAVPQTAQAKAAPAPAPAALPKVAPAVAAAPPPPADTAKVAAKSSGADAKDGAASATRAVDTAHADDTKSESAEQSERKSARADRKSRRSKETQSASQSGRMMVRTIEFADGRVVTITRPIGKGGPGAAKEALDRAAERAMAADNSRERRPRFFGGGRTFDSEPDRSIEVEGRRYVVESDDDREPALARADDEDLAPLRLRPR